jgi:hypothetical protein
MRVHAKLPRFGLGKKCGKVWLVGEGNQEWDFRASQHSITAVDSPPHRDVFLGLSLNTMDAAVSQRRPPIESPPSGNDIAKKISPAIFAPGWTTWSNFND